MANPAPGYSISTIYRKSGSWSCGYHTGADFACPAGTRLVAAIAGQIRHRNHGSALGNHQFSISPDPGQPFAGGEVFYAHTRTRLADGTYVSVGDFVAEAGDEGNASGPHLHFEYHPNCKNCWGCEPTCANPQVVIEHQAGSGGGSGSYPTPTSKTVYVSRLKYGQEDSDSVWYLQDVLNRHSLPAPGNVTLPLTGNYWDQTSTVVVTCQQTHGFGGDPIDSSYVGPAQAEHLFAGSGLTVVYDTGPPNPSRPDSETPPPSQGLPEAPALMLFGAVWNPITNFPGLRPFTGSAAKVTLHTTETDIKPNWEQQQSGIPHLTVDLATGQRWQHLPFDVSAYTLSAGAHSPNSDAGMNIQIEIIGHTDECPIWDQTMYNELQDILFWLSEHLGVPYSFPYPFDSPPRLTWDQWDWLSGIFGHCHVPYNDHHDPTGLRTDLLSTVAPGGSTYVTRAEWSELRNTVASVLQALIDVIEP